jgi:hypothetical protein
VLHRQGVVNEAVTEKKANYYILPPLEECRDYYTKVMGAGIDWPEEEP